MADRNVTHEVYLSAFFSIALFLIFSGSVSADMTVTLDLKEGWNLISLPIQLQDNSIESILSDIDGKYDIVVTYDPGSLVSHYRMKYGSSWFGDLSRIEQGRGYWIHMTEGSMLSVTGNIKQKSVELKNGYNLIGWPSIQSNSLSIALSSIDGKYDIVVTYDPGSLVSHYRMKYGSSWFGDLSRIEPKRGYWIRMTSDAILLPPNATTLSDIEITSLIFTRSGAVLSLKNTGNDALTLSFVNVYDSNNEKIGEMNIDRDISPNAEETVIVDFGWNENSQYEFEIIASDGNKGMTAYSPGKPSAYHFEGVELGDVEPTNITKTTTIPDEAVAISPDGRFAAVASFDNRIRLIDILNGDILWSYDIVEGEGTTVAFSNDGNYVLAGEKSADAYIYCFRADDGNLMWKYRAADDTGTYTGSYSWYKPKVMDILVSDNEVYSVAYRYWKEKVNGTKYYYYNSTIYKFNIENGEVIWKITDIDSGVYKLSIDSNDHLVFATSAWDNRPREYPSGSIYYLNVKNTPEFLWNYTIEPTEYKKYVSIWKGISISQNGEYVAVLTGLGRAFLFNSEGNLLWAKNISTPIEISGITIYGYGDEAHVTNNEVIFAVGSTFKTAGGRPGGIEHPSATSLFSYDMNGNLKWKWKVDGYPDYLSLSEDGRYLAVSVAQNIITEDTEIHGAYIFDLERPGGASAKLSWFYHTDGVGVTIDISPDGKYIAFIEAPVTKSDGETIGEHKLHILL